MSEPTIRKSETESDDSSARRLVLADWHRQRGARMRAFHGVELPFDYGDSEAEGRALRDGLAWIDGSSVDRLELTGEDRQRFVHGLCTVNVRDLEPGRSVFGFVTDGRGRVLAELVAIALEDRLWLVLPPGRGSVIAEHLARYRVADRVEILPLDELLPVTLAGPRAVPALVAALAEPAASLPGLHGHREVELFETQLVLQRHPWQGVEGFTVWLPASLAPMIADEMVDRLPAVPAGFEAVEDLRIENGWPRFGVDYGPENLPQEIGLESAVDLQKGCYLGQEVVARLHYRGQAPRRLQAVSIDVGKRSPQAGEQVVLGGRSCGELTSVARSRRLGGFVGLAMLQRRALGEALLELELGGSIRPRAGIVSPGLAE